MNDGYPEGVMGIFKTHLIKAEGVEAVVARSLNALDVNGTLGVCLDEWVPLDYEMIGSGAMEPTLAKYTFSVQHVVKHGVNEEGERIHREVAKAVRLMLYRDPAVQVSLRSLSVQEDGRRERTQKFYVADQRYASNEATKGTFVFLSTTEFVVETETISL